MFDLIVFKSLKIKLFNKVMRKFFFVFALPFEQNNLNCFYWFNSEMAVSDVRYRKSILHFSYRFISKRRKIFFFGKNRDKRQKNSFLMQMLRLWFLRSNRISFLFPLVSRKNCRKEERKKWFDSRLRLSFMQIAKLLWLFFTLSFFSSNLNNVHRIA